MSIVKRYPQGRALIVRLLVGLVFLTSAATLRPAVASPNDSAFGDVAGIDAQKLHMAQAKLTRMQQIADRFSGEAVALGFADNAWRFELVNHLMRADQDTVRRVEAAADLRSALATAAAPSGPAR